MATLATHLNTRGEEQRDEEEEQLVQLFRNRAQLKQELNKLRDESLRLQEAFEAEYSRQFGRAVPGMTIEVLNWSLELSSKSNVSIEPPKPVERRLAQTKERRPILCDVTGDWRDAEVFDRADLRPGDNLFGPSLILEPQTTTFVSADFSAQLDSVGNIWLTRNREAPQ